MRKIKSEAHWANSDLETFTDLTSTRAPPQVHQPLFTPRVVFPPAFALVCVFVKAAVGGGTTAAEVRDACVSIFHCRERNGAL